MNPNGGVDASVNRPFIRFSYPGYLLQGIRSENISMHGGIEARGTTLPPHSPLAPSFVSFPSYTTWRMHIPPVPLASPLAYPFYEKESANDRIEASLVIDRSSATDFSSSLQANIRPVWAMLWLWEFLPLDQVQVLKVSRFHFFCIWWRGFLFFFFYLATLSSNKEGRKRG